MLGTVLLVVMFGLDVILHYYSGTLTTGVKIQPPLMSMVLIFVLNGISEEIIFRGYIQSRLTGLIRNSLLCSLINGLLFLLIHYPVRWVVSGFSFTVLSGFYIITLMLLHFMCDFVYKKTDCLWGAILLHILFNLKSVLIFY